MLLIYVFICKRLREKASLSYTVKNYRIRIGFTIKLLLKNQVSNNLIPHWVILIYGHATRKHLGGGGAGGWELDLDFLCLGSRR